jgi:trk system potassium uptake protein TrkH
MGKVLNLRLIIRVIARISFIISVAFIVTAITALIFSENVMPFLYSFFIAVIAGIGLNYFFKGKTGEEIIQRKDAFFSVTISWFYISIAGSLPYLFSSSIPTFPDAFFESVSGFTTTGSSILTDIEILPKSILLWRSLTHWIGGIGIIVLFIVIMPTLREGSYHLFTLESSFQDKIQPRIRSVGRQLMLIYIFLTVAEIFLLLAGGMNLFESVCHAFGTIATGGFSPKNAGIGGYSPYIQYVVMFFMLLSGMNFIIHYYLLKRQYAKIKENEEVKFYLLITFFTGSVVAAIIYSNSVMSLEESFREAFFQVISIITCTGYATADYLQWPVFAWLIIFFAMFLGGSTGSTAGGIKIARHVIFYKNILRFFCESLHPNAVVPIRYNGKVITESTNSSILSYPAVYLFVFIIGCFVLLLTGLDGKTAASSAATAMAGIGPGIGTVGPAANFAHLSDLAKYTMTILMILGRLEIYTVLILLTRNFWRE